MSPHLNTHPGPMNLGSGHKTTIRDLTETTLQTTRSTSPIVYLPRHLGRPHPDGPMAYHSRRSRRPPVREMPTTAVARNPQAAATWYRRHS